MSTENKIRLYVEELFLMAPKSHRTIELKEELIANLEDKYSDLISQGKDEALAYDIVISSIGDIDELIRSLQEKYIYDPEIMDQRRHRSAILVSCAVGLYIFGIIPGIVFSEIFNLGPVGPLVMIIIWTVATMILVYNNLTKPKYDKHSETMVEEFKEWSTMKNNHKEIKKAISSILWLCATIVFIGGGFIFGNWHILWMVYLLAAVVQQIIGLLFVQSKNDDRK